MALFTEEVKKYGSVAAALAAKGYEKTDSGWKKPSSSSGSSSSKSSSGGSKSSSSTKSSTTSKSTSTTGKAYSSQEELMNTNWQEKINQAEAAGDYTSAALYEQARNDKINSGSYTGKQTVTNKYTGSGSSGSGVSGGTGSTMSAAAQQAATDYYLQAAYDAAKKGEWDAVGVALNNYVHKSQGPNQYGEYDMKEANAFKQLLDNEFGYDKDAYYKGKYESVYGEGSWDKSTGTAEAPTVSGTGSSTVGGTAIGGTVSQPGAGDAYGSFEDFMEDMGYDDMSEQTRKAIQAAVDAAVNGYQGQIQNVNDDTRELARQAYINKMLGEKNLDQQMAAYGYAGGMADSQRIGLQANYENNLQSLEQQRVDTVRELEMAIENAKLTGDMQTAQELSGYLQNIQAQWNSYLQAQRQMANQNYWNQMNLDNQNYWNQQEMDAQRSSNALNKALTLIGQGYMPEDDMLAAAGITRTDAQRQIDQVLGTSTPVVSATRANASRGYNNGGLTSEQVRTLQTALGVTPDGLWGSNSSAAAGGMTADQAWAAYQQVNGAGMGGGGMQASHYNAYENSIVQTIQSGYANNAVGMIDAIWGQLSPAQQTQLQNKLSAMGLSYQP